MLPPLHHKGGEAGDDGTIQGDVDIPSVKSKAGAITPVPGGVGPVTVACLMENTLKVFTKIRETP